MNDLFIKYGVKDLKHKHGQSECHRCKSIHRFSLTWTSFLWEYDNKYFCDDCLKIILLAEDKKHIENDNIKLRNAISDVLSYMELNLGYCIDFNEFIAYSENECSEELEYIYNTLRDWWK